MSKAKKKPAESAATPPQVVQEYSGLGGKKLRVVIDHAPGIDYYVVVQALENDQWKTVKRSLQQNFDPVNMAMEVAIMQLAHKLATAEETIRRLQSAV